MSEYTTDTSNVTAVWNAHGHRFMSDSQGTESCLVCGATYQLLALADDPSHGEYLTAAGDEPAQCTGDTSMVHGYERHCDHCDDEAGCAHCAHECPCVACK